MAASTLALPLIIAALLPALPVAAAPPVLKPYTALPLVQTKDIGAGLHGIALGWDGGKIVASIDGGNGVLGLASQDYVNTQSAAVANTLLGATSINGFKLVPGGNLALPVGTGGGGSGLQPSANLSDLSSPSAARTNLGLGSAAVLASTVFDASGAAATAQSAAIASSAQRSANLSDLSSASTARGNLGLGSLATQSAVTAAQLPTLTGDVVNSSGGAMTLATVNSSPGTVGDGSHVAVPTVNGKGLVTGVTTATITPAGIGAMSRDLSTATPNAQGLFFNANYSLSGQVTNPYSAGHLFFFNDTASPPAAQAFVYPYYFIDNVQAGHSGQRNGTTTQVNVTGKTNDTSGVHNYVAHTSITNVTAPLNPGSAGAINAMGQYYAENPVVILDTPSSPNGEYALVAGGAEYDVITGAPVVARAGIVVSGDGVNGNNPVEGTYRDSAFITGGGRWKAAFEISNLSAYGGQVNSYPLDPTSGAVVRVSGSVAGQDGIDLSALTPTRHAFIVENGAASITKQGDSYGAYSLNLQGRDSYVNVGNPSVSSPSTVGSRFYSSGNGNYDAAIAVSGGSSTAGRGNMTLAAGEIITGANDIRPGSDAASSLGTSAIRWNTIYASNGTIQTSDERKKAAVAVDLSRLAAALSATATHAYVWKNGSDKGRIRFGVYAQELAWALYRQGLNWQAFSFLQYDKASDSWGVNYVELQNAREMLAEAGFHR